MPQLDITVYTSQIFWLIISFGILYGCMHWMITPRILKIFQRRRSLLEEKLEEIEKFREKIEQLETKIELLSAQSQKESSSLLVKTQKECDKALAEEEINLQQKISAALEVFTKKLDLKTQEIQEEISKKQTDFSDLIFQQLITTDIKPEDPPQ